MDDNIEKKAEELILKFIIVPDKALPPDSNKAWIDKELATKCAIKLCNEMLAVLPMYTGNLNPGWAFYNNVKTVLQRT